MNQTSHTLEERVQRTTKGAQFKGRKVDETARSTEQLDEKVQEVAGRSQAVSEDAGEAIRQANGGEKSVRDVINSIQGVDTVAKELQQRMERLGDQARQIGSIITVIQDIADQTNLLALNAAIEAARAGDAGRGFAVVADEVRKLAEKTMAATQDVTGAITAIQKGIVASIESTQQAGEAIATSSALALGSGDALRAIVEIVGRTSEQIGAIAALARDQAQYSSTISQALKEIQEVSSNTLGGMENAEQSLVELSSKTGELGGLIECLKDEQSRTCTQPPR